jgi:hypothetical protein
MNEQMFKSASAILGSMAYVGARVFCAASASRMLGTDATSACPYIQALPWRCFGRAEQRQRCTQQILRRDDTTAARGSAAQRTPVAIQQAFNAAWEQLMRFWLDDHRSAIR